MLIPFEYILFLSYSISKDSFAFEPVVIAQRYSRGCASSGVAGGSEKVSVWKMIEGSSEDAASRMKGAYPSALARGRKCYALARSFAQEKPSSRS